MKLSIVAAQLWRDDEGAALVESVIVLPFLLALILGTLEFSNIYYEQHLVSTGVRDAARFLARSDDPTSATIQSIAKNLAATGSPTGAADPRVTGFATNDVSISFSTVANSLDPTTGTRPYREAPADCGGPDAVRVINVSASFTYVSLGLLGYFGLSSPDINVSHSERCIGVS